MLKVALAWGLPHSPSWEHLCPAQTLDPGGWETGGALCPIRSLWSSAFPCSDPRPMWLGDWGSSLPHQVSVVLHLPLLRL